MSCLEAPKIGIPDIPGLDLLLGDIALATPGLSAELCCKIELPSIPIPIPLGAIFALLRASVPSSTALDTALAALDTAVKVLNGLLDQLSFDCPLD